MKRRWHKFYPDGIPYTVVAPVKTIFELLARAADANPEGTVVVDNERELKYHELKEQCEKCAAGLIERGFEKGKRIALMMENRLEYIIAYYAVHRIGGIVVQVNPSYQPFELRHIFEDSGLTWVICKEEQEWKLNEIESKEKLTIIKLDGKNEHAFHSLMINSKAENIPSIHSVNEEDTAVLQYTSGTTGKPKGVMLTHSNIVSNTTQNVTFYRIKKADKIIGASPLYHGTGISTLNIAILSQGTYIMAAKYNTEDFLEMFRKHRPTIFPGIPTMFISLLNSPNLRDDDLKSLRMCTVGGAPMPTEVIRDFETKSGSKILEAFGLSEATSSVLRTPMEGLKIIGSCGIPIPSTDCKIVDIETGKKEMAIGEAGELLVKGPQVMKGYWNNEKATKKTIKEGWLYTGDIATQDESGYFYIVGRIKEMIVSSGFNIYPKEIEEVLYQHPEVVEAVVLGVPDSYRGETVKAFLVTQKKLTKNEIEEWCRAHLSRYKVPKVIEFRDKLPKTTVGKILKKKLLEEHAEL